MPTLPSASHQPTNDARLYGLGSVALAGLVGGPLAIGYLVAQNVSALRLSRQRPLVLSFFVAASACWLWLLYHVPRDALSQLAVHLPQLLVWWLFTLLLLRSKHAAHALAGGTFKSTWGAIGIAVLVAVAVRVLVWLASQGGL